MYSCIKCKFPIELNHSLNTVICDNCSSEYPLLNGKPVFLKSASDYINSADLINSNFKQVESKNIKFLKRLVPSPSVNLSRSKVYKKLNNNNCIGRILIVGGGTQKCSIQKKFPNSKIVSFDIDLSSDVDCFADAHHMPFVNDYFDLVIITAVLQHVPKPIIVVSEIYRCMKPSGFVYSENAFLQHVIEGGYDFQRTTLSGHKLLFFNFKIVDSGVVAGPFTVLYWWIENTFLLFFNFGNSSTHRFLKFGLRFVFAWISRLDWLLINFKGLEDMASSTYILANKTIETSKDSNEDVIRNIINNYSGIKSIKHF
ncbi:MAG: class I SAM-dependent methyltransferase [Candidatus Pelagibacter sp.]|nr:class I SAM-dependent methyltransferase [Candidatus Pelagibacter sp.]